MISPFGKIVELAAQCYEAGQWQQAELLCGQALRSDRANVDALYLLGLDPIEETTADINSYGFRSQRCCADALDQCHKILRKKPQRYVDSRRRH